MRRAWVLAYLAGGGCSRLFGLDQPSLASPQDGAVGDIDAFVSIDAPDASACTAASVSCAGTDILRTCTAAGSDPTDTTCSWGCSTSNAGAHCAKLLAAGGVLTASDPTMLSGFADVTITASTAIDTDTGAITNIRAAGTGTIDNIDFQLRSGGGVFRMRSLTIAGPLLATGNRPLVLVVDGAVSISALLDLRGTCSGQTPGPGGRAGAGPGGTVATAGGGSGGAADNDAGGGGGGHGGVGGKGASGVSTGIAGGAATGNTLLTPLTGGGGGGGGGDTASGGGGGGGGGAVQIVTNTSLVITSSGVINAGGCGGEAPAQTNQSGGGGGAGGAILLEAPTVTIDGTLAVNGGGGGGGDTTLASGDGQNGTSSRTPAAGGIGSGVGGVGASASVVNGGAGTHQANGGGGGGAIGRIRVYTRTGTTTVGANAVMSPAFTDATTATEGTVTTQ